MNSGGIAQRLIDFARVLVGQLTGGLAYVNVIANMLFGAISGSAAAAASAIGSIMGPEMKKEGYEENFSAAVNISSATTGLSIPPSNVLIVYSLASGGASITALFLAGYIPGILTGLAIMITAMALLVFQNKGINGLIIALLKVALAGAILAGIFIGIRYAYNNMSSGNFTVFWIVLLVAFIAFSVYKSIKNKDQFLLAFNKFLEAFPSLLMLVIVIGGIVAGFFTATEASAVAVLYALVLAMIYKTVKWHHLPEIFLKSVKTTAIVLLLVGTSMGLSWIMAYENIPQNVSAGLLSISDNPFIILLIINMILLFVGVFMDMTPAVLIFTPIFLPIVQAQLGLSPIHFGIIMVLNLSVGLCTPPVGSVLFIGCSVSKVKIETVIKPLLPMFIAMVAILLLVTYNAKLALWLPGIFGY
jgi:TRAP-type C4-dicarboxylate transport system permease large subunit